MTHDGNRYFSTPLCGANFRCYPYDDTASARSDINAASALDLLIRARELLGLRVISYSGERRWMLRGKVGAAVDQLVAGDEVKRGG